MASTISDLQPTTSVAPEPGQAILAPLAEEGSSVVSLWEVVRISLDSLLANKLRSLLTMLGVIIGVGSVVALLALGNGASSAITSQLQSNGTNLLTILPGSPSRRGPGSSKPTRPRPRNSVASHAVTEWVAIRPP